MFRKTLAALLVIAAITAAVGAIPGVANSVAFACNTPDCGGD